MQMNPHGGGRLTTDIDTDFLQGFADAWNCHDIEALMSFMVDDCVFELSSGPEASGTHYEGRQQVREGYQKILDAFPDAQWAEPSHFVAGDRGVTEWTFRATMPDGSKAEVNGCDIFTFRDGKIAVKDSYRKIRSS